ncbi:MAG: hypothetical protein WA767_13210, partial [Pseudolabrys sp.]
SSGCETWLGINRGNCVADRQCCELLALPIEKYVLGYDQRACLQFAQLCKDPIEISFGAGIQDMDL